MIVAALAAVVLLLLLLRPSRDASKSRTPPEPSSDELSDRDRAGGGTARLQGGADGAGPSAVASAAPSHASLTSTEAENVVDLPPETQPLSEEFFPGTTEWEEVPLLDRSPLVIRFMPKRFNVVVPQPIVLLLQVVDRSNRAPVKIPHMLVRVRSFAHPEEPWTEVPAVDDGSGEDAAAGDGMYTATYAPTGGDRDRLLGRVLAEGVVTTPEAGVRRIPASLIYTRGPRARMTGVWRDAKRDGHLVIEGEIDVEEPGVFTLMAQVVGPEPRRYPIALARAIAQKLESGKQWLTLRVWGKLLRDLGVDGPYQIVNVLLTRDNVASGDYDPGVTIAMAHVTQRYLAMDFSGDPWKEPVVTAEQVGPDHPSQRDKPHGAERVVTRPTPNGKLPAGQPPPPAPGASK